MSLPTLRAKLIDFFENNFANISHMWNGAKILKYNAKILKYIPQCDRKAVANRTQSDRI